MPTLCNNPQCRGVLNERTPARCPECGVPTGVQPREQIDLQTTPKQPDPSPEFTPDQMVVAINQWLQFGEDMFNDGHQQGYFSGDGWAARSLRAAREFIEHTTTKV